MRTKWRAVAAAVAALAALGGSAAAASAAPVHNRHVPVPVIKGITVHPRAAKAGKPAITIPRSRNRAGRKLGGGNLEYWGGPVQKDPQVFLLFWGSWWASGCSNSQGNGTGDESYLYAFYHGLATQSDLLSPIASQYGDSTGTYPTYPTTAGQAFITWNADCTDPPQSATDAQLAAEAAGYASFLQSEGYTISNSTQIVVVSPSGTNPGGGFGSQYCAYHNWASFGSGLLSWTNLPYIPDAGGNCGAGFVQNGDDGWSIVGGHEYMESVTDPFVNNQTAWVDNQGFEIGDKCAWTNLFLQATSTGSFAMQPEWDNATSSCQPAFTYPRGPVKLWNAQTHCMEDKNGRLVNGTAVILDTCNGWARQSWVNFPDGSLARSVNTGECANITNHSSANGTPVDLFRCSGDWNQVWIYNASTHWWVNPHTGKCLRDANGSYTNGTPLVLWTCLSGYPSEQWTNV